MSTAEHVAAVIEARGWRLGTELENRVARWLDAGGHRPPAVQQQHRAGRYRLDFAWPDIKVALEADGWHHQSPDGACRDGRRDAELRRRGWIVLRVADGDDDELVHHLLRVGCIVNALQAAAMPT